MSRLLFHSTISVAGALAVASVTGCGGGDQCGPGSAPASGLTAAGQGVALTFGQLTGGLNNDCPDSNAPPGVTSLTIIGSQTDGSGQAVGQFTLCIGRPDQLASEPQTLGGDIAGVQARVVDVTGTSGDCMLSLDTTQPIMGTASTTGLCDNGSSAAGFALTLAGSLSLSRICGGTPTDSVATTLSGTVAVKKSGQ